MSSPGQRSGGSDVAVVGGGLAGLTAATTAARAGADVVLFEARDELGGRARTDCVDGFSFNQGGHALYRAGAAMAVLRELGIKPRGRIPVQRGGRWVQRGEVIPLTRLKAVGGVRALRAVKLMTSRRAAHDAAGSSLAEWFDHHVDEEVRPLAEMLVRTTGYGVDFAHQDAEASLDQLRKGAHGVLYVDGGWATLVAGLRAEAERSGVIMRHERVTGIDAGDTRIEISTAGASHGAGSVVVAAGGARHVDRLVGGASPRIEAWASTARPILASALDLALDPESPVRMSAYGLGDPTYLVDHAVTAKLAPPGSALIHCLWYEPDLAPDVDHRVHLEASLDLLRPGWRAEVVDARFSRRLVVAHDRPQPGRDEANRPTVRVPDLPGVFVAGDWITGAGMLADAAMASGRAAGIAAAETATSRPTRSVVS